MLDPVINTLQPFVVALLIGLMAGIERERSQQEQEVVVGMRTFTLIALLGAIAGYINVMELTLSLSLFVIVMVGLGYWRSTHANPERGLTTEIAAAIIFSLGYMAIKSPILAGLLGILLVAILFFRSRLHWFAKDVLQPQEIATFILLLIFIFIIIPFFPDRPIDIWNLVNPRKLAQVLVFIAIIQFGSYIAKRIAGARVGLLITGFLGGFVSSTVVFLDLARVAKNQPNEWRSIFGACLLAIVSPLLLFLMIVNATAPHLTPLVAWPTMVVASLSTILGITIAKKATPHQKHSTPEKNPLEVRGIIKLGVLIFGLLTLVAVVEKYVGTSAVLMMSFLAGFFELHGITLANATLSSSGGLSNTLASQALLLAVAASFLSKTVIVWILAPIRFATLMTAAESLLIGVGVLVYFWFRP